MGAKHTLGGAKLKVGGAVAAPFKYEIIFMKLVIYITFCAHLYNDFCEMRHTAMLQDIFKFNEFCFLSRFRNCLSGG